MLGRPNVRPVQITLSVQAQSNALFYPNLSPYTATLPLSPFPSLSLFPLPNPYPEEEEVAHAEEYADNEGERRQPRREAGEKRRFAAPDPSPSARGHRRSPARSPTRIRAEGVVIALIDVFGEDGGHVDAGDGGGGGVAALTRRVLRSSPPTGASEGEGEAGVTQLRSNVWPEERMTVSAMIAPERGQRNSTGTWIRVWCLSGEGFDGDLWKEIFHHCFPLPI